MVSRSVKNDIEACVMVNDLCVLMVSFELMLKSYSAIDIFCFLSNSVTLKKDF